MEQLIISNKKFFSSKRTGHILGYTNDYVGKLCREGKLLAKMVGRTWYAEWDSVEKYSNSIAIEKSTKREEISKEGHPVHLQRRQGTAHTGDRAHGSTASRRAGCNRPDGQRLEQGDQGREVAGGR